MRKYIIIFLVLLCFNLVFQNKINKEKLNKLLLENKKLSEDLKSSISIKNNKVQVIYKDKQVIKYIDRYIPPEGDGTITIDNDDEYDVDINNKGFTFTPSLGLGVSSHFTPQLGARLFFWDRWGGGLGLSPDGVNIFIDRRIDDFFDFMQNSSVGLYSDKLNFGIKLSTFF